MCGNSSGEVYKMSPLAIAAETNAMAPIPKTPGAILRSRSHAAAVSIQKSKR